MLFIVFELCTCDFLFLKFSIFALRLLRVFELRTQTQMILHCFSLALWKSWNAINSSRLKLDKFHLHPTIHKHMYLVLLKNENALISADTMNFELFFFFFCFFYILDFVAFFMILIKNHIVKINCCQLSWFDHNFSFGIHSTK